MPRHEAFGLEADLCWLWKPCVGSKAEDEESDDERGQTEDDSDEEDEDESEETENDTDEEDESSDDN